MNAPDGGYESAEDVRSPPHEMIEYFTDCADGLVEDYDIIFVTMSQWYIDTVFKCDMKSSCWKKSIKGSGNIPPEIDTREKMQKVNFYRSYKIKQLVTDARMYDGLLLFRIC